MRKLLKYLAVGILSVSAWAQGPSTKIDPNVQIGGPLNSSNYMLPGLSSDGSEGLVISGDLKLSSLTNSVLGTNSSGLVEAVSVQPLSLVGDTTSPSITCSSTVNALVFWTGSNLSLWQCSNAGGTWTWNQVEGGGGGSMTWPASAGIMVYAGADAYGTSLTAPTGSLVGTGQSNTWTTGTQDFSSSTQIKLPISAGYASAAQGEIGYDSTNLNWHTWENGVDNFVAVFPSGTPPTSGHVAGFLKTSNSWSLEDLGTLPSSSSWPGSGSCSTNEYVSGLTNGSAPTCAQVTYSQLGGSAPTWDQNTTGYAAGLAGGALGSVPYQSADNTTTFLASPTTSGHTFVYAWAPSGSVIAPEALDLASYLASPPAIGSTSPGAGSFSSLVDTGAAASSGDTWCLQINSSGQLSNTGATCGSGSGGSIVQVNSSTLATANLASTTGATGITVSNPSGTTVNFNLATDTLTLGSTTLTLGGTTTSVAGLTVDGVSPTTMGYLDATSSIQTQLNGKVSSTVTTLSDLTTAAGGAFGTGAYAAAYTLPGATSSSLGGVELAAGQSSTTLATVATTGAYGNLSGTPTFPTGVLYGNNSTSAPTAATSSEVQTAIGADVYDAYGAASTAQTNAETYASNGSNISSGTVAAARLPAALSSSTSVNGTSIPSSVTLAYLSAAAQTFTNNVTAPEFIASTEFSGAGTGLTGTAGSLTAGLAEGLTGTPTISVNGLTVSGTPTFTGIEGASTYCLQISSTGVISNTGAACGSGSGGSIVEVNSTTLTTANFASTTGATGITVSNPSGSTVNLTLATDTLTLGSTTLTLGGTTTSVAGLTLTSPTFTTPTLGTPASGVITNLSGTCSSCVSSNITATSNTTLTSLVDLATVGTIGTGTWQGTVIANTYGGTGQSSASSTGIAQVSSGTWSFSTALANGTTASTQTTGDNSTKVATDAFVLANAGSMTWPGTGLTWSSGPTTWGTPYDTNCATALTFSTSTGPGCNTLSTYATLASPTFTGTVTIPSGASISGYAPLASPAFTGTPTFASGFASATAGTGSLGSSTKWFNGVYIGVGTSYYTLIEGAASQTGNVTLISPLLTGSDTIATIAATQTLTNKNISGSEINSGTIGASYLPAALANSTSINGTSIPSSATLASIYGSITTGHCAEWYSSTQVEDAGAACGSGGSGTVSDGSGTTTAGYMAESTGTAHTIGYDTLVSDNGSTFAYTGTSGITAPSFTSSGSTHGVVIPAGTAVSGVAGSVIFGSDSTNGYAEVNENNTGLSRICTAGNSSSVSGCGSGGSGANTALSNLSTVSINTTLIPQTGVNLGASATPFKNLYLFGSGTFGTGSIELTGNPSGTRVVTFPDQNLSFAGTFTNGDACTYSSTGNIISCNTTITGGGNVSTSGTITSGYYSLFNGSTTIATGHLDDGVTTSSIITSSENFAVNNSGTPSQLSETYTSALTPGSSTTAVYGVGSAGQAMVSEAGGAAGEICTSVNGVCSQSAVLASNYTMTGAAAAIPGLDFTVAANTNYAGTCNVWYETTAASITTSWEFTGPASPTAFIAGMQMPYTTTTAENKAVSALSTAMAGGSATDNTLYPGIIRFTLLNGSTAGTLQLEAFASTASDAAVYEGSTCTMTVIP